MATLSDITSSFACRRPAALMPLVVAVLMLLSGCEQPTAPATERELLRHEPDPQDSVSSDDYSRFQSYLGLTAYTSLAQAAQRAQQLDQRLSAFLHQPDATHLVQVQSAWRQAYDAYLRSLVFAYLPINDPVEWRQKGIDYQSTLVLLDSWPVEGGYIDHVPGYPFSGIVNDLTLELTEDNLHSQHGFSDPSYASLGYHALEFMLWGSNGDRDPTDFVARENTAPVVMPSEGQAAQSSDSEEHDATAAHLSGQVQNHNRRRQYIQLLSNQLMEHLQRLTRRWEPSNGYYSELLEKTSAPQATLATLIASQALISREVLDRRLGNNSSEFSNTGTDDVIACLQSFTQLLSATDHGQGMLSLINDTQLVETWQQQLASLNSILSQWQEQGMASQELSQQVRSQFIELLSLLEKTADALSMRLPRLDELSRR